MNNTRLNTQNTPSEIVERKFSDVQIVDEWEVENDDGWQNIISINKTIPYNIFRLIFNDGKILECADTHILIDIDGNEVFAVNSLNAHIKTKNGSSKVISIEKTTKMEEMYDLTINNEPHTFYTNNILSHNSTVSAACVLWYLIFQEHKTVAILANKGSTSREILSRIKSMYENLPKWLQVGVTEWNKGSFTLGNHNNCIGAATSSSAIRGCISGDSLLEIKENGKESIKSIADLFDYLKTNEFVALNTKGILLKSHTGYVNFDSVVRYNYNCYIEFKTDCGVLKTSENHPIYTKDGLKRALDITKKDLLEKENCHAKILSIKKVKKNINLFDIINAG